ncbi:hypothetical protein BD779DRAFT_1060122 [Infundibulicybe gibba]|nr:hypothetical protein BD779DRAFT_1060122 [Infundibulicybe gibba]
MHVLLFIVSRTLLFTSNNSLLVQPSFQNNARELSGSSEYPSAIWDRQPIKGSTDKGRRDSYSLPSFSSSFQYDDELPPSSEFDASESCDDLDISYRGLYSDHASDSPSGHVSDHSSEWDQEEGDESEENDDDGFSFPPSDTRATFFRTSAERGRWMSDPIPMKPVLPMRRSAPTSSHPLPSRPIPLRPISEPAVCTLNPTPKPSADRTCSIPDPSPAPDLTSCNESSASESEILNTPSLVSGDDGVVQPDVDQCPSPGLPPSSPPSPPTSPQTQFISPLSSPIIAPSSPLSLPELACGDDLDLECDGTDLRLSPARSPAETPSESSRASEALPALVPQSLNPSASRNDDISDVIVPLSSVVHEQDPNCDATLLETKIIPCSDATPVDSPETTCGDTSAICSEQKSPPNAAKDPRPLYRLTPGETLAPAAVVVTGESDVDVGKENIVPTQDHAGKGVVSESPASSRTKPLDPPSEQTSVKGISVKDHNGATQAAKHASSHKPILNAVSPKETSEDRRKRARTDTSGQVKKKPRTNDSSCLVASSSNPPTTGKRRLEEDIVGGQKDKPDTAQPKTKKQKRSSQTAPRKKPSQPDTPKSSLPKSIHNQSSSVDPKTAALDAEMCGMLIESMATSRASSLPISTLYRIVMQSRPSLKAERTEKEWFDVFERVLSSGQSSRGGSGVFGKVESSFKDDSDRPLEAQWFYVPELDEDQDRATLIRSMMPRPGKRSETKKYKQYYYRPLDKISRWDPKMKCSAQGRSVYLSKPVLY